VSKRSQAQRRTGKVIKRDEVPLYYLFLVISPLLQGEGRSILAPFRQQALSVYSEPVELAKIPPLGII
jgi:hypothetical protein